MIRTLFAAAALAATLVFAPTEAFAFTIVPDCAREQSIGSEAPGLDCALETFKGIAFFIFGISGSVALFFFVYGGFKVLLSGFSDQVSKGKEMIRNAVIGLAIIMVSSYATDYFIDTLTEKRVETLGAPCEGNGVWGYDSSGVLSCLKNCDDLIGPGYQCVQASSADFASCNDLIDCGSEGRCCSSGIPLQNN